MLQVYSTEKWLESSSILPQRKHHLRPGSGDRREGRWEKGINYTELEKVKFQ
jgi:hypothetical protein